MKPYRTVLHGTCLLNGNHPPGSQLALECPVLRRARRAQEPSEGAVATTLRAPSEEPLSGPTIPGTSTARFYDGPAPLTSRRPVGRPAKHASARIAQREASRAYRARQRQGSQP
jgi:hypothetical protein